jgi:hypothetical protein
MALAWNAVIVPLANNAFVPLLGALTACVVNGVTIASLLAGVVIRAVLGVTELAMCLLKGPLHATIRFMAFLLGHIELSANELARNAFIGFLFVALVVLATPTRSTSAPKRWVMTKHADLAMSCLLMLFLATADLSIPLGRLTREGVCLSQP